MQNRHECQSKLKSQLGFYKKCEEENPCSKTDISNSNSDNDSITDASKNDKKTFKVTIPYLKYIEMEPEVFHYKNKESTSTYEILKPNTWSDIINDNIVKKRKMLCNFLYNWCQVRSDMPRSQYFLYFEAVCKDCRNFIKICSVT